MVKHQPPTKFLGPVIKAILSLKCHFYNTLIDCKGRVLLLPPVILPGGGGATTCLHVMKVL